MAAWQIQQAKAHLSEVVKQAQSQGPQEITLHGRPVAMVIARDEYERLTGGGGSLVDFMSRSPLRDAEDLVFSRDDSLTRDESL